MKNNHNIRKNVIFALTFFLSFLLYIDDANASGIANGQSTTIMSPSEYSNVTCSVNENTGNYFTLTRKTDSSGRYTGYLVSSAVGYRKSKIVISCDAYNISKGKNVNTTFEFTAEDAKESSSTNIKVTKSLNLQFHTGESYLFNDLGLNGKVTDVNIVGGDFSGDGYSVTKEGADVRIKITSTTYKNKKETKTFNVTYKDSETGQTVNVEVELIIDYAGEIRIYPGGHTCNVNGWTGKKVNETDDTGSHYQYSYYYKNASDSGTIDLPSCEDESTPVSRQYFKGWAKGSAGHYAVGSGECEQYLVTNGAGTVNTTTGDYTYYACYTNVGQTYLYAPNATVDGAWKEATSSNDFSNANGFDSGIYSGIYVPSDANATVVTLPTVKSNDESRVFIGWRSGSQTYEAGTVVANDGSSYSAVYKTNVDNYDNTEFMRQISVGQTDLFVISGKKITSCSTSSDKITTHLLSSGECQVKGISNTGGEFSAFVSAVADGKEYTAKYAVIGTESSAGDYVFNLSDGTWYENNESSGVNPASNRGYGSSSSASISANGCSYVLGSRGEWPNMSRDNTGEHQPTSSRTYEVKYTCGGTSGSVNTLCLDPGLVSPNPGDPLVVDFKLDGKDSSHKNLYNVAKNIVKSWGTTENAESIMNTTESAQRVAANIAVRLANYLDEGCSGMNNGSGWALAHDKFFIQMCKDYKGGKTHLDDSTLTAAGNYGFYYYPGSLEIVNGYLDYLKLDTAASDSFDGIKLNQSEVKNHSSSSSHTYKYSVDIKLSNVPNQDKKATCSNAGECGISIVCPDGGSCSYTNGTLTYEGDTAPNSTNWGLSLKSTDTGELIVLKRENNDRQRLIILGNIPEAVYYPAINTTICPSDVHDFLQNPDNKECCSLYTTEGLTEEEKQQFNSLCNTNCSFNNYAKVCNLSTSTSRDNYEYKEATTDTGSDMYGGCIVYTERGNGSVNYLSATDKLKDNVGNSVSISSYSNNTYCRYTCGEEWKWSFESYNSHIGNNAAYAGSYFQVDNDVYLSGTSKCTSTYVDYERYAYDMQTLANNMVLYYNEYANLSAALKDLDYGSGTNNNVNGPLSPSSGGTSSSNNHTRSTETCYYYGSSYTTYNGNDYCGWDDWGSYSSGKCTSQYPTANSDGSGYKYECETDSTDATEITNKEGEVTGYKCPSGYSKDGTTCYRHRYRYAKTCYGTSGGNSYGSDASSASNNVKFECHNYLVRTNFSYFDKYKLGDKVTGSGNYDVKYGTAADASTTRTHSYDTYNYYPLSTGSAVSFNDKGYATSAPTDNTNCKDYNLCNYGSEYGGNLDGTPTPTDHYKTLIENINVQYNYSSESYAHDNGLKNLYNKNYSMPGRTNLQSLINNLGNQMNQVYTSQMKTLASDFDKCQNTYINNKEGNHSAQSTPRSYSGGSISTSIGRYSLGSSGQGIDVSYDPKLSYTYEESMYMKQIGQDNTLHENVDGYGHVDGKTGHNLYSDYTSKLHQMNDSAVGSITVDGTNYDIYVNKFSEELYQSDDGWASGSSNGMSYSGTAATRDNTNVQFLLCYGDSVDWKVSNDKKECGNASFTLHRVNYNKLVLQNSGFYSNKGLWLKGSVEDVKRHVLTDNEYNSVLQPDGKNARSFLESEKKKAAREVDNNADLYYTWGVIGGNHNVFPIRYDTPRNIYQYAYSMKDIGVYFNSNAKLGRIMGYSNSVYSYNTYSCFYEVVEDFCRCCGAKIDTTISDITDVDTENYTGEYSQSEFSDTESPGALGYFTSSVNLSNLKGEANDLLGNWKSNKSIYYLTRKTDSTTNRGSDLKDYIESNGDNVYDSKAGFVEYSYVLTPSVISEMRNTKYNYGILVGEVVADNSLSVNYQVPSSGSFDNLSPSFTHIRSKWLETTAKEWENPDYSGKLLTSRSGVCSINSSSFNASSFNSLRNDSNCRWIDYVETSGSNKYRMAFK